jgi:hypothetical protein
MLLYTRNLTSKVPVHIFLLENIVDYIFEDLRKPKAPNTHVALPCMKGWRLHSRNGIRPWPPTLTERLRPAGVWRLQVPTVDGVGAQLFQLVAPRWPKPSKPRRACNMWSVILYPECFVFQSFFLKILTFALERRNLILDPFLGTTNHGAVIYGAEVSNPRA